MRLQHLYKSDTKLTIGQTLKAICGKEVIDVRFDFTPGGNIAGKFKPSGDFCPNCEKAYLEDSGGTEYLYGIFPAKWVRSNQEVE